MARAPKGKTVRNPRAQRRRNPPPVDKQVLVYAGIPELQAECVALEAAVATLRSHVNTTRQAFFRLAQVRAADMVLHQRHSWDDGAAYINAEMAGLDQQLAQATPQAAEQPA